MAVIDLNRHARLHGVAGDVFDGGRHLTKAKALGIAVIDEAEFLRRLAGN